MRLRVLLSKITRRPEGNSMSKSVNFSSAVSSRQPRNFFASSNFIALSPTRHNAVSFGYFASGAGSVFFGVLGMFDPCKRL